MGKEESESLQSSPEGSEKENKDTNGVNVNGGEMVDAEGNLIKGKGKSKGKSEDCLPLAEEVKKRPKKSTTEIYETLCKTNPEEGDEDSEDSEDEEFEGMEDADSDDEDGDEVGEGEREIWGSVG